MLIVLPILQDENSITNNKVNFNAFIAKIGDLEGYFGHFVYDANEAKYSDDNGTTPQLDQKADFYLNDNIKISNGMIV